ncbi:MAG: YqaA family protein [Candidatus Woesearchaeota archaeon]
MILEKQGYGFWLFLVLVLALALILIFIDTETLTETVIDEYGYLAIFILAFLLDFIIQPVGPDIPLMLGVSVLNPLFVLIAVLCGSYLTMIAAYYIGKNLGEPAVKKLVGEKKFEKIQSKKSYGKWYLAMSSLTPLPYVPYLSGMWNLSFKEVVYVMVIPRTIRFCIVLIFALAFLI